MEKPEAPEDVIQAGLNRSSKSDEEIAGFIRSQLRAAASSKEAAEERAALLAQTNLDTNQEKIATSLEDRALIDHMNSARARCQETMAESTKIDEASARTKFSVALGRLSRLVGDIREPVKSLDTAASEVLISGRHIPAALGGQTMPPHFETALPADLASLPEIKDIAAQVGKHLSAQGERLTGEVDKCSEIVASLSSCHMELSAAYDQVVRLLHHKDELLAKQKEALDANLTMVDHNALLEAERRRSILEIYANRPRNRRPQKAATISEEPATSEVTAPAILAVRDIESASAEAAVAPAATPAASEPAAEAPTTTA